MKNDDQEKYEEKVEEEWEVHDTDPDEVIQQLGNKPIILKDSLTMIGIILHHIFRAAVQMSWRINI